LDQVTCNGCPKRGQANQSYFMPEHCHCQANQQSPRIIYVVSYLSISLFLLLQIWYMGC